MNTNITKEQKANAKKDFDNAVKKDLLKTENIFAKHAEMTLAKLAKATAINHATIMSYAKKPIEGQIYDPTKTNYAEIDKLIEKKKVDMSKIDWAEAAKAEVTPATSNATLIIPNVGEQYFLKYDKMTYNILATTPTHVVLCDITKTEPRVMKFSTFTACRPVKPELAPKADAEAPKAE
jgi:hypothetical protein